MKINPSRFGSLVIGFYAWVISVFFGGILIDIVYSKFLLHTLSVSVSTATFSHVSDILLCLGGVAILAASGSIILSWNSRVARNLFIASLLILIFEFITPVLFSQFMLLSQSDNLGSWIRIVISGSASLLAYIGLRVYYRQN